jgi:hypothetical protein
MSEHVYFTQALVLRYTLRHSLAGRSVLLLRRQVDFLLRAT